MEKETQTNTSSTTPRHDKQSLSTCKILRSMLSTDSSSFDKRLAAACSQGLVVHPADEDEVKREYSSYPVTRKTRYVTQDIYTTMWQKYSDCIDSKKSRKDCEKELHNTYVPIV